MAVNLDDHHTWQHLDTHDMLGLGENFPTQCREALEIGRQVELPAAYTRMPANIVIAGMGGSAIGGDLFARIFQEALPAPVQVVRFYDLPAYVDENSLVVACSYSGNTEETLAIFDSAVARGARVIAVTSGGELETRCRRHGAVVVKVPGGQPPRASTGYLLMPLVALAPRLGLVPAVDDAVAETLRLLDDQAQRFERATPTAGNQAKQIAQHLHGRFPLVYATNPTMGPIALRWRTQLNENSKVLAISTELPELNHNEVVGWELGLGMLQNPAVLFLGQPEEHPRIRARLQITKELLGDTSVTTITGSGSSTMAQMLTAMYLGDMATVYLAFLNGVDPYAITPINYLKDRLAEIE